jgi:hypothetical protein
MSSTNITVSFNNKLNCIVVGTHTDQNILLLYNEKGNMIGSLSRESLNSPWLRAPYIVKNMSQHLDAVKGLMEAFTKDRLAQDEFNRLKENTPVSSATTAASGGNSYDAQSSKQSMRFFKEEGESANSPASSGNVEQDDNVPPRPESGHN